MSAPPLLSVAQALQGVLGRARSLPGRDVDLAGALGLILDEPIHADIDLPPFTKALMDGYAVRSSDLGATDEVRLLVVAEILAGQTSERMIGPGEAARIMTGAPLPPGADAVVAVERSTVDSADPDWVKLQSATRPLPGQFCLAQGREMRRGDLLLEPGTVIRGGTIGLVGSAGRATVRVIPRPSIKILSTGDELVTVDQSPPPGKIRNTNGPMLMALARSWGATDVQTEPAIPDEIDCLIGAFEAAVDEADVLIISGGVSAGVADLVPAALGACGVEKVFHKVAVKPGKPIWFGVGPPRPQNRPGTLVFGLPGNPASGVVGFLLFVQPALNALAGRGFRPTPLEATFLGAPFTHRGDRPTYHPVRIEGDQVYPMIWAGSADLRTVAIADGFAAFAAGDHEYQVGERIEFLRLV